MKFAYVDESGDHSQGDVFVMAGLLIDAYRLPKHTTTFDELITSFIAKHPDAPKELKTKRIINGSGGWSKIDASERKKFVADMCHLATQCARIFAVAFSFKEFETAADGDFNQPFKKSYWLGSAMFVGSLIQKKMQGTRGNKGLTVFICDDNKHEMSNLSDMLHDADPWFDPIYQTSRIKNKQTIWEDVTPEQRFDQIINSAFAIKSHHSSLIQVADAVSYSYRRHLELKTQKEEWVGEKQYFSNLFSKLELQRARLGRTPGGQCIDFYRAAGHKDWVL
jgi:hypothetical protein